MEVEPPALTTRVWLTRHAVGRYRQRLRPALSFTCARNELIALLDAGVRSETPPTWAITAAERPARTWYLLIGDDVCLPVVGKQVVTCLVRGEIHPLERARRDRERRTASGRGAGRGRRDRRPPPPPPLADVLADAY